MAQWKNLKSFLFAMITFVVWNLWNHIPTASGSDIRLWDEIQVDYKNFKILYGLKYLSHHHV